MTGQPLITVPTGVRLVDPAGIEYPCACTWRVTQLDGTSEWVAEPQGLDPADFGGPGWRIVGKLPPTVALRLSVPA